MLRSLTRFFFIALFLIGLMSKASAAESDYFIITVDATTADETPIGQMTIPSPNSNYQLLWEEVGNEANNNSNGAVHVTSADHVIDFGASGIYRIKIDPIGVPSGTNDFDQIEFNLESDNNKLLDVAQWGTTTWFSMKRAFYGATETTVTATDVPDLSATADISHMFRTTSFANPDVSAWDTSNVTDMNSIFHNADAANPDVSTWDTSLVTDMSNMFLGANVATPDVSNWNTSNVTDMSMMFRLTPLANPDVSSWDVSSVTTMSLMFHTAEAANPDVSAWDTSQVVNMGSLFTNADVANPDVSLWDTSSATNMSKMFYAMAIANPDVSAWDTSSVTDMSWMFRLTALADPDVSSWDTSSVTDMGHMFAYAEVADPDVSSWDTSQVVAMGHVFLQTELANPDVTAWNTSSVTDMTQMFRGTTNFDRNLSNFDFSSVTVIEGFLDAVTLSTANYDTLLSTLSAQTLQPDLVFSGGNSSYCESAADRGSIILGDNWTITDNGDNCTETYLSAVLEDSASTGGANNLDGNAVTAAQLTQIDGVVNVNAGDESAYQNAIALETGFSNPPTVAEVQEIIDSVNEPNYFVFTVDATIADLSPTGQYTVPSPNSNYQLTWEEVGNEAGNNSGGGVHANTSSYVIDFGNPGIYRVKIDPASVPSGSNDFDRFHVDNDGDNLKLIGVEQWGTTQWSTMESAFHGASNLTNFTATDAPDFSQMSSMARMFDMIPGDPYTGNWDTSTITNMMMMFSNAVNADPDTSGWDTQLVTTMQSMFWFAASANPDTSSWDTSSVTNMHGMFTSAILATPDTSGWDTSLVTAFSNMFNGAVVANPDTSQWNTANVTTMSGMFQSAVLANPDASSWNTSQVTNMSSMFYNADSFNTDISAWDTSSVTNMSGMFTVADIFNQPIGSWNTANVTTLNSMFYGAISFNQDLSGWDTSANTSLYRTFREATVFNGNISSWNTSNVTDMMEMFLSANTFNQDISLWDTSSVTRMTSTFASASLFNQDVSAWDVSLVNNFTNMFAQAPSFNQDISGWDVSSATNLSQMFAGATVFDADIGGWDISSVTSLYNTFGSADAFNRDIGGWNTSSVTDMRYLFQQNDAFNQDISGWDTSSVTDMSNMFLNATVFDQNIGAWDFSAVTDMSSMFSGAKLSTLNYDNLLASLDGQTLQSNVNFHAGNSTYCASADSRGRLETLDDWNITDGGDNCTETYLLAVLEDSLSFGGASNTDGTSVSASQLSQIDGLLDVNFALEVEYQNAVLQEYDFSNPPTVAELQVLIDGINNNDAPILTSSPIKYTHDIVTGSVNANTVIAIDIDNDGDIDVASASRGDDTVAWYENDGSENFTMHTITTAADGARSVIAVDLDADGDVDLLSASVNDDTVAWYENDGSENFTAHVISSSANGAFSVKTEDVDGDGDLDVLSASYIGNTIDWFENDGSQVFTAHRIASAVDGARHVDTADIDGDGDIDVIATAMDDDTVVWYENDGSENFIPNVIISSADGAFALTVTDIDLDGDIDVITGSIYDERIIILENDGSGIFSPKTISTTADGVRDVVAIDFDEDGDVDIFSASLDDDQIAWYENLGGGDFVKQIISKTANGAFSVFVTDVDGDSDLDVLSTSYYGNSVEWYESDADINYVEGEPAVILDANVHVYDKELVAADSFSGSTLTLSRVGGVNTEDHFEAVSGGTLSDLTQGGNLVVSGATIGTVQTNASGSLLLSFNANATGDLAHAAITQIAYKNISDAPPVSIQLEWQFDDGGNGVIAQGTPGALQSANSTTVTITETNDAPTGVVTIDNTTPKENDVLTASHSIIDPDGLGVVSYQWQRNNVDIPGETNASYAITAADFGTNLQVLASYTDDGGTNETVSSAATASVLSLSEGALIAVLEDSDSTGGANNGDGLAVSFAELLQIDGLASVYSDNETDYQSLISSETGFSNPPTVAEVQTVIDAANEIHYFIFTVDASIADSSPANQFIIPTPYSNYQYSWEEIGNESGNNSGQMIHADSAFSVIDFGSAGSYRVKVDPVGVPSGSNDFQSFSFNGDNDNEKFLTIEQWGSTRWTALQAAFRNTPNFTVVTASDVPDLSVGPDIYSLFQQTPSLLSIANIENWDVSNVPRLSGLFSDSPNINPDVSTWDISSITDINHMFSESGSANPDMSNWDMSSVTDMAGLFRNATSATPDTSSWDTSNVTDMSGMFQNAVQANPDVSSWNTSLVTNMSKMFQGAVVANPDTMTWNTASVTDMSNMFYGASIANPNTSGWDVSSVTDFSGMFYDSTANPDTSSWNTSSAVSMAQMFRGATNANPDTSAWNVSGVVDLSYMFYGTTIANPTTSSWDVSSATNMSGMFGSTGAANPDTGSWDTSLVTDMSNMFSQANVADPDTSAWDVSSVTNMTSLFHNAHVADPDVSNWDTSSVTSMSHVFYHMEVANPDVSAWDTSSATDMFHMFRETLNFDRDLSNFDFSGVTRITNMMHLVTLSTTHYDALLTSLDSQTLQPGLTLNAGNSRYCLAETSRSNVEGDFGWTFNDGGRNCTEPYLLAVLEDSASIGGANNTDAAAVLVSQLLEIDGLDQIISDYETEYQAAIASESGFSNPPTIEEVQAVINAVNEAHYFVMTVDTTVADETAVGQMTIPSPGVNYQLFWEEVGNEAGNNSGGSVQMSSAYQVIDLGTPGIYRIKIDPVGVASGVSDFNRIYFNNGRDKEKLLDVEQWGSTQWINMQGAFYGATNASFTATDVPNLSGVSSAYHMFSLAAQANPDVSNWDVSSITNMIQMFWGATNADPDVSNWDTSAVTNLTGMFTSASSANPDVSQWDTSSVTNMASVFSNTLVADPDVSNWDTSNVTNMNRMFLQAAVANPDTSNWDTSSVTNMYHMFASAAKANPNTSNWDVSSVTTMQQMFQDAVVANPDTANWDTSSVTTMRLMFTGAASANPDTSGWNTSNVTSMGLMFSSASVANPDTSNWDTSSVTDMASMFYNAPMANPDTSGWDVSQVTTMSDMFINAVSANPDTSQWDTSSVVSMYRMFSGAATAVPDTSGWDVSAVTNMQQLFNGLSQANPDVSAWDTSSVTNMNSMLSGTAFTGDISHFDFSQVAYANSMLWGVTLSTANYDALLSSLSDQTLKQGVTFSGGNSTYCLSEEQRNDLLNNDSWLIHDGGRNCSEPNLLAVLEDSASLGGASNIDNTPVTVLQLNEIDGVVNVASELEADYQAAIASEIGFSNPPLLTELQAVIDQVNDPHFFIVTVDSSLVEESQLGQMTIPSVNSNYQIYWEEVGNELSNNSGGAISVTQPYQVIDFGSPGIYRVKIDPLNAANGVNDFDHFGFNNQGDKSKLIGVHQWGTTGWISLNGFFYGANQLADFDTTDTPDFSAVTDATNMFRDAALVNPETGNWDTSSFVVLESMFYGASSAAPDTSNWDVSSVTNLGRMFRDAVSANPDVSNWDTSSVQDMSSVFRDAILANPDVSAWDTSAATQMNSLFAGAVNADPDVTQWNTSNVTTMFNLFARVSSSNPDVTAWDTSSATNMRNMFKEAASFDRDVSGFDFSNVTLISDFLTDVQLSQENYDALLISLDAQELQPGLDFHAGTSNYCLAEEAHANIIANDAWTITDGGKYCTSINLTEILEDSSSEGGAANANGVAVTAAQLSEIDGLIGVRMDSESQYQSLIGLEENFSNPPTVAEVQLLINAANASVDALAEILEDSDSQDGENNSNGSPVTIAQLNSITDLANVNDAYEIHYQVQIAQAVSFSNPPALAEVQALIDSVNASQAAIEQIQRISEEESETGTSVTISAQELQAITGLLNLNPAFEPEYQLAIAGFPGFSIPPTTAEVQLVIDTVNLSELAIAEVVEDSNGNAGNSNGNSVAVTAEQLSSITGLERVNAEREAYYQSAIANAVNLPSNPSIEELQALIDEGNSTAVMDKILEDSISEGGSGNADGQLVTIGDLQQIVGLEDMRVGHLSGYQEMFLRERNFSTPPTLLEVQLIIDVVNAGDGNPSTGDADNDGIPNELDADDDNDGMPDLLEGETDTDNDGIPDSRDGDSDNDGMLDKWEWILPAHRATLLAIGQITVDQARGYVSDVDQDGVPDYKDLDSDNDGLLDTIESNHLDENLDGRFDGIPVGNSAIADETSQSSSLRMVPMNTELQVLQDARVLDRVSNDLLLDQGGVISGVQDQLPQDSDGDGVADFRDPDSDNDGLFDVIEAVAVMIDVDQDGRRDDFEDLNANGLVDEFENNPVVAMDSDGDGSRDAIDIDSDGDGLSDVFENGGDDADHDGRLDNLQDEDGNGVPDVMENSFIDIEDSDNDGTPDFRDPDSDGDGITDFEESGAIDADGDGQADALVAMSNLPDRTVTPPVDLNEAQPEHLVFTGGSGTGCSVGSWRMTTHHQVQSKSMSSQQARRIDPMLLLMLLVSMGWLYRASRIRQSG